MKGKCPESSDSYELLRKIKVVIRNEKY